MSAGLSKEKEIRALIRGWEKYIRDTKPRDQRTVGYLAGVRACIEALNAVLGPEEGTNDESK